MRYFLSVCLIILCSLTGINAQINLSGTVTDAEDGTPLIGVSVSNVDSQEGTITDVDGRFELSTIEGATLEFSYLGYLSLQRLVEGSSPMNIQLQANSVQLDDIVITGLGTKRQKRALGYSTEEFDGSEIALSNAPNVVSALSGRSAGVNIVNSNGVEGGTSRITIRGNNNIRANNQPLIIVDGVPIENPPGLTKIGRGTDWGSAINNINAEDIEDVNILKGPTASAKYGMRGANGVVLITTKKGTKRKGVGIQYSYSKKIIEAFRYRKVQNTFGAGGPISLDEPSFKMNANGEFEYPFAVHSNNGPFGRPTTEQFGFYSTGVSWGPRMEGQMVRWWDGELRAFDPQPDNLKQYFSTGFTDNHNINFSNGGDFGSIRVSMSYQDHEAVIPNSNFEQYTFNIGSELNISERLTSTIGVSYINFNRKNSPSLGDDNEASFGKGILYSWPRSYKGLEQELNFNADGTRNTYGGQYPFSFSPPHLWWNAYNHNTYLTRNKMIASLGLGYQVNDWLHASLNLGLDFNLNEFEERDNPTDALGISEAFYGNELDRNLVSNNDVLITATKESIFESDFDVQFSVGGTRWSRDQYGLKASTNQWQNPWLFAFDNYTGDDPNNLPLAEEIRYNKKINSMFSFLNFGYKNMLFLELSGRNDWSSALPVESNSYFYPSASFSYILSESVDLSHLGFSFVKLRGAYARTASDTDPFLLNFVYDTDVFSGQQTASLPGTKPPTTLRPQQANSYELGLSLGMLQDKINIDFTYYYIKSFDQILDSPVPASSGVNEIRINNGVLENAGYELGIEAYLMDWSKGYMRMGLNVASNKNFVQSLGEGAQFLEIGEIWGDFGPKIMVKEGDQYGTIYGYDYQRHPDSNEPILNDEGTHYLITDNLVPVGNASPDFTGGWTLDLKHGNIKLSSLIDASIGGDIYAGSYVIGRQTGQSPSSLVEREGGGLPYTDPSGNTRDIGVILPGVYANGQENDKVVHYYYKYLPNAGGWGKILTTQGILENNWVKMRQLSLSYSLQAGALNKLRYFDAMDISIVGRDLFYLYSAIPDNVNPEGGSGAGNAQGLEWAAFPSMRSISFRISTKF